MPYILKKTNGNTLTTVQDASVDNTTNLVFVGRNYSGYGQPIEENFVKLLENFSNTTKPSRPVQGQLWFNSNTTSRRLNVCYDGVNFRDVSNIPYGSSAPTNRVTGDLWWDSANNQIKVYDSVLNTWTASQPYGGASSSWDFGRIEDSISVDRDAIKGYLGTTLSVIFSSLRYQTASGFSGHAAFPRVHSGITLPGANAVTGSSAISTSSGYLLWGTAADALKSQTIDVQKVATTSTHYVTFTTETEGTEKLYTTSTFSFNPITNVLNVTAASALYADVAERYAADGEYDAGTVLVIGGEKEVTIANQRASVAVAGIVSTNPAYLLNGEAGDDITHPPVALKGRVPCKVVGPIKKGDLLVSDGFHKGHASKAHIGDSPHAIIGKALQDFDGIVGTIEVKV